MENLKTIKNVNCMRSTFRIAAGIIALALLLANGAGALSNDGGGSWQYYRDITINNTGSALSDYQVLVNLTGSSFPMNAQTSGADIRFTDASENELSCWIENWNYTGKSAKIWVNVTSIPAGGSTIIRMYYGNPGAASASNGTNTFEVFDDFNDNSKTDWHAVLNSDVFTETNNRMEYNVTAACTISDNLIVKGNSTPAFNFVLEFKSATSGSGSSPRHSGWTLFNSSCRYLAYTNFVTGAYFNGYSFTTVQNNGVSGAEASYRLIYNGSSLKMYRENTKIFEAAGTLASPIRFGLNGNRGNVTSENSAWWDDFRVRKYASPEPAAEISEEKFYFTVKILINGTPVVNESAGNILKVKFSNFSRDDKYVINIFNDTNNNGSLDFSEDEIVYTQNGTLNGSQEQIIPVNWTPESTGKHWVVASGGRYIEVFVTDIKPLSPIPELATIVLVGAGMIGLMAVRRNM